MWQLTGLGILGVSALLPVWVARVTLGLILATLEGHQVAPQASFDEPCSLPCAPSSDSR